MNVRFPWKSHRQRTQTGVFYQYYATIHPTACEVCLRHHGQIYQRLDEAPRLPQHPGCRCSLLEFPARELDYYEEHSQRMRERARRELRRRELFHQGREALARDELSEALALFQQSIQIDVYVDEIEVLCREQGEALSRSPEFARRLRDLFLKAYRWKFDLEKYQHMPEGMRSARQTYGLQTIRACFEPFMTAEQR